ncbi:MAG: DUF4931 domain-containing protein [Calditerrivibrio sp.]|nr:DUF4931 domain-containing protein [Calditerrivibrio sp.]
MSFRFDPIRKRWIIFAPERGERGDYIVFHKEKEDPAEYCPFCPGNENYTANSLYEETELIDGKKSWHLRVIPNKYPIMKVEEQYTIKQYGPYAASTRLGAHEVIIDTRDHNKKIFDYSKEDIVRLINAASIRIEDLKRDIRLKYITMIKNSGKGAGATMSHPHSQILAFPFIPNDIKHIWQNLYNYYFSNNRCLICDIIHFEMEKNERIILKNDFFVAISPFASKHSFEVDIIPLKHTNDFLKMSQVEKNALSDILKDIFQRYKTALDQPPFNMNLLNTCHNIDSPDMEYSKYADRFFHWYVELIPRINRIGGIEKGTGVYINPFLPERCADILKNAL